MLTSTGFSFNVFPNEPTVDPPPSSTTEPTTSIKHQQTTSKHPIIISKKTVADETAPEKTMEVLETILGKYQFGSDGHSVDILPPPIVAPVHTRVYPPDFVERLRQAQCYACPAPRASQLHFQMTTEACAHNAAILATYGYDLDALLLAESDTPLGYGSEFKPIAALEPILGSHPLWPQFESILRFGAEFPLEPLSEEDRIRDVAAAVRRGNHKSAIDNKDILLEKCTDDVLRGRALPVPTSLLPHIPGVLIAPMGVQMQHSFNEFGDRCLKPRLTHDQSWVWESGTSVNSRTLLDELPPVQFGHMLLRMCHHVHALRLHHPNQIILINKTDVDAAYRRMHAAAATALQCGCILDDEISMLFLRLTFGGRPCPALWCIAAEIVTDFANDIINCPNWTPDSVPSPMAAHQPEKKTLDESIPFGVALPVDVTVHLPAFGTVDDYIDDLAGLCLDDGDNARRVAIGVILALELVSRPLHPDEPLPRKNIIALGKMLAEGTMEERKIILGWLLDTRRLLLSLPGEKYDAWTLSIHDILHPIRRIDAKTLHTLEGRLQRVAYVVPGARFFLSRLRHLRLKAQHFGPQRLSQRVRKDLALWLTFLAYAKAGVSLNCIVHRRPAHFFFADACNETNLSGLGGYSASGRAWRLRVPPEFNTGGIINVLEFMAQVIPVWTAALEGELSTSSCFLSSADSTSAVGWMHRSQSDEGVDTVQQDVSRTFATILIDYQLTWAAQHIAGDVNTVADWLSRRFDLSDVELTAALRANFDSQVPTNFHIKPLPNEVSSWATSTLQRLYAERQSNRPPVPRESATGSSGKPGATRSDSMTTSSSSDSIAIPSNESWAPLPPLSAVPDTLLATRNAWAARQSKRPSLTWRRTFGSTVSTTQGSIDKDNLHPTFNDSGVG